MKVKFWGTRGSIAAPGPQTVEFGGNTTCVEILSRQGRRVVIDAGTGIRALGEELLRQGRPVRLTLLLTHTHWDHILGMAFFKPIYLEDSVIEVDGCPRAYYGLASIFDDRRGNGYFPVAFDDLKAHIYHLDKVPHGPLRVGDLLIHGIETNHPQGGMGFRITEGDVCLVFLTDNELRADGPLGRRPEDYALFTRGCQLLIHDAQYTPEELPQHRGWGHSTYADAVELALAAGVRHLVLFHHDPSRTDAELRIIEAKAQELARRRGNSLLVTAAREGEVLDLTSG